jgi:hypothetical protein
VSCWLLGGPAKAAKVLLSLSAVRCLPLTGIPATCTAYLFSWLWVFSSDTSEK